MAALASPVLANPKLRVTYRPKCGTITGLSFRSDGKQIGIGTEKGMLKVKDLTGGEAGGTSLRDAAGWCSYTKLVYNTHAHGADTGLGSLVTLGPAGHFTVFYTDTFEEQTTTQLPVTGYINPIAALSGDGRYMAFSAGGPDIWIGRPAEWQGFHDMWTEKNNDWTASILRRPEDVHGNVTSLSLNRDGSRLAASYHTPHGKGVFVIFNRNTGRTHHVRHVEFPAVAVAFGPQGKHLAAVGNGHVWLGAATGEHGKVLPAPHDPVWCVAFSPNERWMAAGCSDGTIYLWDTEKHHASVRMRAHDGGVRALAWAADGRTFVSGGNDGAVKIWDMH